MVLLITAAIKNRGEVVSDPRMSSRFQAIMSTWKSLIARDLTRYKKRSHIPKLNHSALIIPGRKYRKTCCEPLHAERSVKIEQGSSPWHAHGLMFSRKIRKRRLQTGIWISRASNAMSAMKFSRPSAYAIPNRTIDGIYSRAEDQE